MYSWTDREKNRQTDNMVCTAGGSSRDAMSPSLLTSKRAVHSGESCRILLLCNNHGVFLEFERAGGRAVRAYVCVCVCVCVCGWVNGLDLIKCRLSAHALIIRAVFTIVSLGDMPANRDWLTSFCITLRANTGAKWVKRKGSCPESKRDLKV